MVRTYDGIVFRILNILDKYTRESLAVWVARDVSLQEVIDQLLLNLFVFKGVQGLVMVRNSRQRR